MNKFLEVEADASTPYSFQESTSNNAGVPPHDNPTVARYSLSSHAPRLTDALPLAERVHAALVELSDGSSVFTGCDDSGVPLKGNAHAYILCESNCALGRGQGGEITHITVFARAGFGSVERSALECLREVFGSGLDVQLTLLGLGLPGDFSGLNINRGECPLLVEAKTWVSRTPFIPTRYPKATRAGIPKRDESGLQIGSPEHELRRLLKLDDFPDPIAVDPMRFTELAEHRTSWSSFHRARSFGDGRRAGSVGYGFRIEFAEPVCGPIALGYGAHFGVGGFRADFD